MIRCNLTLSFLNGFSFQVGEIFNFRKSTKLRDNNDFYVMDFNTTAIENSRIRLLFMITPEVLTFILTACIKRPQSQFRRQWFIFLLVKILGCCDIIACQNHGSRGGPWGNHFSNKVHFPFTLEKFPDDLF